MRRILLVLLLAACSGDGTGPATGGTGTGTGGTGGTGGGTGGGTVLSGLVEVHITGTSFNPSVITITPGTTVRWINDTGDFHTVTPENTGQPNLWQRTVTAGQGTVVEKTFTTGGGQLYRYRCEPHSSSFTSGMTGSITVQ